MTRTRTRLRALAYLFGAGGTLGVVALLLPLPPGTDAGPVLATIVTALVAAAAMWLLADRLPRWSPFVLVAVGISLISGAVYWSGGAASVYASFYIWVGVYGFYFFGTRAAYALVAYAGLAYGVVLAIGRHHPAAEARWLVTLGTVVVAGTLIARLVTQVRGHTAELGERAERLREAQAHTRAIVDSAREAFVAIDAAGRIIDWNPAAERVFGWPRDDVLGLPLMGTITPPSLRGPFQKELDRFLMTGESMVLDQRIELRALHADGHEFPIEMSATARREGDTFVFNAFVHDISERKAAERAERERAEDMALIARVARDLSTVTGAQAAREALCQAAREVTDAKLSILLEPDPRGRELVATAADGTESPRVRIPFAGEPSGAARAFSTGELFFAPEVLGNPGISQRVATELGVQSALFQPVLRNEVSIGVLVVAWGDRVEELSDRISSLMTLLAGEATVAIERADFLARLEAVARTDDLTGLANRRAWEEELPRELSRARRDHRPVCVAMLDLDRFKEFNDEHGHLAGDRLLKELASTWREMLRPTDVIARYGGEEFSLVLPNCSLRRGAEVVERLRGAAPEGQTCSAGITCWDGSETPEELLARADAALYDAKRKGRDRTIAAG